jgi:ABC-2 type transport system ATP-binding protein
MLEVKDLHKFYGSFHAVRGISFDVQPGEIIGFLGPNGAGKTTTMKIITGYLAMTAGEVRVDGHDVVDDSLYVRSQIGYLPENAPLYEDMSVTEYLKFICELRGLGGARKRQRIDYVIGVCALGSKRRALIKTLSKGYRQRVGLAQAIVHEPKLVILDEPTVGLDPNQIIEIRELIRAVGRDNTVILSSHILSEVEATCTRVIIIHDGVIAANGTPSDLEKAHGDRNRATVSLRGATSEASVDLSHLSGVTLASATAAADGAPVFDFELTAPEAFAADLQRLAGERGWVIEELRLARPTLEDVFKKLTRGDRAGAAAPAHAAAGGTK